MIEWKTKRDEWKKTRDNAPYKVEKGAVSGVSVGDSIAKIYESAQKGYAPLVKAAEKLKDDLDTYMTKIRKKAKTGDKNTEKYGKFADWIKNNLAKEVATLEADAKEDLKTVNKIPEDRKKNAAELTNFAVLAVSQVGARMKIIRNARIGNDTEKKLKPEDLSDEKMFEAAMKAEGWIKLAQNTATQLAKFSACFKSYKFKIQLPGLEAKYTELETDGEDTEKAARMLVTCCKCTNYDDLHREFKPTASLLQDLQVNLTSELNELVKKLRG